MRTIKARIERRLLFFEKLHAVVLKERQAIAAGTTERLPLLGAKKARIMKAVDSQPLGDTREAASDGETGRMLALLEEKVRAVAKDADENRRLLKERLERMTGELRSMKKSSKVRSAYRQPSASSLFIDDKK